MGHMKQEEGLIDASTQLASIRMLKGKNVKVGRKNLFQDSVKEKIRKDGKYTDKVYRYELQAKDNFIYAKSIEGSKTNCGIVFYPYDIQDFFNIINAIEGSYPGKLELSSNFNEYIKMNNSTSYYGFSVRFASVSAQNAFIIKYCTAILTGELSKERTCRNVETDDILVDILGRNKGC